MRIRDKLNSIAKEEELFPELSPQEKNINLLLVEIDRLNEELDDVKEELKDAIDELGEKCDCLESYTGRTNYCNDCRWKTKCYYSYYKEK